MDIIKNISSTTTSQDKMDTELSTFDNFREEPTVADSEGLFAGGDSSITLQLQDGKSSTGPVEWIKDGVVAVPAAEAPSDEAENRSGTALWT